MAHHLLRQLVFQMLGSAAHGAAQMQPSPAAIGDDILVQCRARTVLRVLAHLALALEVSQIAVDRTDADLLRAQTVGNLTGRQQLVAVCIQKGEQRLALPGTVSRQDFTPSQICDSFANYYTGSKESCQWLTQISTKTHALSRSLKPSLA